MGNDHNHIWVVNTPQEKKLLQTKMVDFDFSKYSKKEIEDLILHMRQTMIASNGIGLSANQIGHNFRVFVAQLSNDDGKGYKGKFYAVFNPKITKESKKTEADIEGCLSVPGSYGTVPRSTSITIAGYDKNQRAVTIKAKGLLARIFQHEMDHLNGKTFTDRAENVEELPHD